MYTTTILKRNTIEDVLQAIDKISEDSVYVSHSNIIPIIDNLVNKKLRVIGFGCTVNSSSSPEILDLIDDYICDTSILELDHQYKPKIKTSESSIFRFE